MSEKSSMRLVLASGSPRRRRLLAELGRPFEVVLPEVDEALLPAETAEAAVRRLAGAKAAAGQRLRPNALVLGADTLVALDGTVLGKPSDAAAAVAMLRALSAKRHEVWTGVALAAPGRPLAVASQRSLVEFRTLGAAEIAAYVATGEPLDKAGAYALQGGAAAFVATLAGAKDNVIGLPLALTRTLLEQAE